MTPPVRPDWTSPTAATLAEAVAIAKANAVAMNAAQSVCATLDNGRLGFEVVLSSTYAFLRERGLADHLAPVAAALPNGTVDIYGSVRTPTPRGD